MPSYNGTAYPVSATQMGLALETTRGTALAPTYWIPVKSPKYKPNLMLIPDETLQGSQVQTYDLVTGIRYDGHGWDAPPYMDSFPILLAAEFGSPDNLVAAPTGGTITLSASAAAGASVLALTSTASAAISALSINNYFTIGAASAGTLETHQVASVASVSSTAASVTLNEPLIYSAASGTTLSFLTTHRLSVLNNNYGVANQPPSVTITDFSGEEWRQMTAAQLDQLTIKGNGTTLVDYTCTWFGNPATFPVTELSPASVSSNALIFTAASVVTGSGIASNYYVQGPGISGVATVGSVSAASVFLNSTNVNPSYLQASSTYFFSPNGSNLVDSSYGTTQTPAPWSLYAKLGGTYTPTIIDWEVDFKRGVKPIAALTGQQQYFTYFAGPLQATGKLTFVEQNNSPELNAFLNAQTQSLDLTLFDQKGGSALNIHASKMQFKTGELDRSKEYVEVMVEFDLLPTATDALAGGVSPVIVSVANSASASYYGA